ncbi:MAG: hypothetical protein ACXABY_04595 [Candidatus Thorarchaeota archaeon]|jgi:hypothetical protein
MSKENAVEFLIECAELCRLIGDTSSQDDYQEEIFDIMMVDGYWDSVSHRYLGIDFTPVLTS